MEKSALDVMRVCATSRCVRAGSRGRSVVKTDEGRMVHSWKESRVMGRIAGSGAVAMTVLKASRKEVDEQAQKSSASSLGRSQKRNSMIAAERSSSTCS